MTRPLQLAWPFFSEGHRQSSVAIADYGVERIFRVVGASQVCEDKSYIQPLVNSRMLVIQAGKNKWN